MTLTLKIGAAAMAAALMSSTAFAESYGPYPITEKSYSGDRTNSVSYTGQVARSVLLDSLKSLAGQADGGANAEDLKATMMAYFAGSEDDLPIVSHQSKDGFPIKQTTLNDISKGKNIVGKTYKGLVPGWPGSMTGVEVMEHLIHHASMSDGGVDLATITSAFVEGRKVITSADGAALTDAQRAQLVAYAETIEEEWTKVLAEATFKYAGSVYKDIEKIRADKSNVGAKLYKDYIKHWGELKGFAMALQTGKENLGGTAVRLNRLIGFGPVTLDESVVTGIDADGNFVREAKMSWNAYQLNMLKVQDLMIKEFGVEARKNDGTENLAKLIKTLDSDSGGAETD